MTGSILREVGLDVGLYTSPHVDDVRERVEVNGHPILERAVAGVVTDVSGYVTERAAGEASTSPGYTTSPKPFPRCGPSSRQKQQLRHLSRASR